MKDEELKGFPTEEQIDFVIDLKRKITLEKGFCTDADIFLAGLKAGRPQWHKVADGDLPKAYQRCYFIYSNSYKDNEVIFSKSNINVLTGLYAFYLDEETGEETTDPCFYDDINDDEISPLEVYAWKEIVLPKEIE